MPLTNTPELRARMSAAIARILKLGLKCETNEEFLLFLEDVAEILETSPIELLEPTASQSHRAAAMVAVASDGGDWGDMEKSMSSLLAMSDEEAKRLPEMSQRMRKFVLTGEYREGDPTFELAFNLAVGFSGIELHGVRSGVLASLKRPEGKHTPDAEMMEMLTRESKKWSVN